MAGGGVFEVRLARLSESVFDPTGGLAQLVQTAETFGISLAGCFSCLVVWASDAAHRGTCFICGDGRLGLRRQGDVMRFRAISSFCRPALFITMP